MNSLEILKRIKGHFNPENIFNKELFNKDFEIIENELLAFKELMKVLKIDITVNNKGEHFLFIDDIAVTNVIPISEDTANILRRVLK